MWYNRIQWVLFSHMLSRFKFCLDLIFDCLLNTHHVCQVKHVSTDRVDVLSEGNAANMVGVLQEFFTSRRDSYYRDPLFFFSLFLYDILPELEKVILMDIDLRVSFKLVLGFPFLHSFKCKVLIVMWI